MAAHLIEGEFQSDKYPTTPRGKVPLSVKDPAAQDLLWEYAQRRRSVDAEFSDDLEAALVAKGFEPPVMRHVDDFLSDPGADAYARWVISHFRLPAIYRIAFDPFMKEHRLFCTYEGERFRVIGASRMGDVWLTMNFDRETGYSHRVDVTKCSAWGPKP